MLIDVNQSVRLAIGGAEICGGLLINNNTRTDGVLSMRPCFKAGNKR